MQFSSPKVEEKLNYLKFEKIETTKLEESVKEEKIKHK